MLITLSRRSARPLRRPRSQWTVLVLALAATFLSADLHAQEALTLERALSLAQERSRQLSAQDSAAGAAREMAVAAGQLPDPTLKAGINNLPVNGEDRFSLTRDFMTMRSIGVMQELTSADKREARSARYEREADAALAARELALASLQRATALAWLERYYRERVRELLMSQRDEARLQIDAADAAYRGGRGAQAEAFAARSAVAQIEDRLAEADRQIATATTQLARWIGQAADRPLGSLPNTDAVRLNQADLDAELAHHPQITMMARQEDVARAEADIAQANRKADWSVELMYSQRGSSYSNMVSLNLSVPLQWDQKNRQDRELAARLAVVEQRRAEREEATREHVAEVRAMLQEWRSNRERLARYDEALIPLSAERTRAALAAYRGGTAPLAGVLDARRAEIDTRIERLRLALDTARLWAQLNYLVPVGATATPQP